MHVSVNAPVELVKRPFHKAVMDETKQVLGRFSGRISRVQVRVSDENGPRGGVDKQCLVNVTVPRYGRVTASAKHRNSRAAVSLAISRARRILLTRIQKRSTRLRHRIEPIGQTST